MDRGPVASPAGLSLGVREVRKQFGPTVALGGLSFGIEAGTVHAVLGENGAGKSTLVKLLSGLIRPDSGDILLDGERAGIVDPRRAHALGIRTAFQEISLIKDLTIAQNFLLMEEPLGPLGVVRRRHVVEHARARLAALGLDQIDPRQPVRAVDLPTRQKIEIARAASHDPRLLILDEPSASLSGRDVAWLGEVIARAKARGATVILISHRVQDVRDFCARLTVLRNGQAVGTHAVDALSDEDVIELMIGRAIQAVFPPRPAPGPAHPAPPVVALEARGLAGQGFGPVSFQLARGRIMGVAALQGMGQRELFLTLFGALPRQAGSVALQGVVHDIGSPADAVRPEVGIGMIPEDRKTEGLLLDLDGTENASLPSLDRFRRLGLIDGRAERDRVAMFFAGVGLALRAMWAPSRQLSGGNQQKIILAKWLMSGARVLLFYDPTRGVDVGTKAEIYRIMRDFADGGGAILFYSTDITELVNLCDEALVLYRGRIVDALGADALTETAVMRATVGHAAARQDMVGHAE